MRLKRSTTVLYARRRSVSTKNHRSGGKFSCSHTTVIPAAALMADIADRLQEVTKISLGFIKAGIGSSGGQRRVKITCRKGNILLAIRDNASHQELTVYTSCVPTSLLGIAKGARNAGLHISFGKNQIARTYTHVTNNRDPSHCCM
jgi:hypothetical protein